MVKIFIVSLMFLYCFVCSDQFTNETDITSSYYLHPLIGNDSNSGRSENSPLKTFRKLLENGLKPGDRVYLASGVEFNEPLLLKNVKGTKNKPILISNYPDDGKKALIRTKGSLSGVLIENCSFINVQNLDVVSEASENHTVLDRGEMRCGILVKTTIEGEFEHIYLKNLHVHDVFYENSGFIRSKKEVKTANGTQKYGWGIRVINNNTNSILKDVKISDCKIENVAHTGIKLTSRRSRYGIQNFHISNNKVLNTGGPGIQMSGVAYGTINENIVDGSGSNSDSRKWGRGSGLWTWGSKNILIEKNTFSNAKGPADSAGAHIDYNCNNIVLQYNFSSNNAGGFCEILGNNYNCSYRYNISVNDGYRIKGKDNAFQEGKIFWLSGYAGNKNQKGPFNSYFYNNTIYVRNGLEAKIAVHRKAKGILIANNIFHIVGNTQVVNGDQYNPATPGNWQVENVIFKNNLFLNQSSWPKDFPLQDIKPLIGNAKFRNKESKSNNKVDFKPLNVDLIKDQGIIITKIPNDTIGLFCGLKVEKDILGNPINGLPDIGAVEL